MCTGKKLALFEDLFHKFSSSFIYLTFSCIISSFTSALPIKNMMSKYSKGASHNSVPTVQTVLFISTVVLRRIQFHINRRMDGYHYETLRNRTEDDLIKFYEISYKRNIIFINKGRDGLK